MASTNGYQIFYQKRDDCWVIFLIIANVPPDIRIQRENLIITALIPGPKTPKNFNSFLRPLVDELKLLQEGVQCFDSLIKRSFILCAHILSWSGDILILVKVMCTTEYNSYKTYWFCLICGTYYQENRHVYFPLKPPVNIPGNRMILRIFHYEHMKVILMILML